MANSSAALTICGRYSSAYETFRYGRGRLGRPRPYSCPGARVSLQTDGYLGTILGAAVGALLRSGHSPEEIHTWVELAVKANRMDSERLKLAAEPFIRLAAELTEAPDQRGGDD